MVVAESIFMEPRLETKRDGGATTRDPNAREGAPLQAAMKEPVHVVCACNAAFVMPLCVTLASLVEHFNPERDLVLHILSNEATAQDREKVRRSVEMNRPGLERVEIHWHTVSPSLLSGVSVQSRGHLSVECLMRILAPMILPEIEERLVYLDSDLVVLADISALADFAAAHATSVVCAAHDIGIDRVSGAHGVFDYAERGIPPQTRYFNSGVMVVNLRRWREENLTAKMLDYLGRHGDSIFYMDQGALNAFLHDDWTPLDGRWNQGGDVLFPELWDAAGYSRRDWRQTRNHPYIVHFSGFRKPWLPGSRRPRYALFFQYLKKTAYRDAVVVNRPRLEEILGFRIYDPLWRGMRRLRNRIAPPAGCRAESLSS
jgi:lipopolysaccharide biosynthesis glycosyltransferase